MEMEKQEVVPAFPPWADLPEFLGELILELLPLVDYIRFAAVCPRWQSIQKQHRLHYSPFPPPMAHPLPWLVPHHRWPTLNSSKEEEEEQGLLDFYSPLERKHHRLPLPPGLCPSRLIYCFASSRGWMLMTSHEVHHGSSSLEPISTEPFLFNPVTCVRIPLPPLSIAPGHAYQGALSAPPTDPECAVLIMGRSGVFLHRLRCHGDGGGWMIVGVSLCYIIGISSIVACGGKFYYQCNIRQLGVIDPFLLEPTLQILDFDLEFLDRYALCWPSYQPSCYLVENEGEVFIVVISQEDLANFSTINEFQIFRADFSRNQWVRVETLGDRAIFLDPCCALSLVAADVGFKKNTIYCSQLDECNCTFSWRVFDLDTRGWIDGTPVSYLEVGCRSWHNCWFLPILDCVDA